MTSLWNTLHSRVGNAQCQRYEEARQKNNYTLNALRLHYIYVMCISSFILYVIFYLLLIIHVPVKYNIYYQEGHVYEGTAVLVSGIFVCCCFIICFLSFRSFFLFWLFDTVMVAFSSALGYCTAELLLSRGRPSFASVRPSVRPSVREACFLRINQAN